MVTLIVFLAGFTAGVVFVKLSFAKKQKVPVRDPERVAELIREGFEKGNWYIIGLAAEKRGTQRRGTADAMASAAKTFCNSKFDEAWENELRWRAARRVMYPWFKERDIAEQKAKRYGRKIND